MSKDYAQRVQKYFEQRVAGSVYTFEFIKSTMPKLGDLEVASKIADFVHEGKLEQFVVVMSPVSEQVLAEFKSILDIPTRVYDAATGADLLVCPEHLTVLYRFPK